MGGIFYVYNPRKPKIKNIQVIHRPGAMSDLSSYVVIRSLQMSVRFVCISMLRMSDPYARLKP